MIAAVAVRSPPGAAKTIKDPKGGKNASMNLLNNPCFWLVWITPFFCFPRPAVHNGESIVLWASWVLIAIAVTIYLHFRPRESASGISAQAKKSPVAMAACSILVVLVLYLASAPWVIIYRPLSPKWINRYFAPYKWLGLNAPFGSLLWNYHDWCAKRAA